jgi:predicted ABC-type exoprotein transport system permease subunit
MEGKFAEELNNYRHQVTDFMFYHPTRYLLMALIGVIIVYLLIVVFAPRDYSGNFDGYIGDGVVATPNQKLSINMNIQKREITSSTSRLFIAVKTSLQLVFLSLLILVVVISIKAGQWSGEVSAKNLLKEKLPRVQLLFKQGTSSSSIKGLEQHVLRKLFTDNKNIYVYSEADKNTVPLPPIYVISMDEISQMWVLQN